MPLGSSRNPFVNQVNSDGILLVSIKRKDLRSRNPFVNQVNSDKNKGFTLIEIMIVIWSQSLRKSGQFGRAITFYELSAACRYVAIPS